MENRNQKNEYYINKKLIIPPEQCICRNKRINVNKFTRNKNNGFCFRCTRKTCKKIIPLTKGSFFEEYKLKSISEILEIFKCFFDFKFNVHEAFNYLTNTKKLVVSETFIRNVYDKIRKYIYYYYIIEYSTEKFGEENEQKYYAIDECLFSHDVNRNQLWVIGLIETTNKDFRLVLARNRDADTIKTFVERTIPIGNCLVTDGWDGYDWADIQNSGYIRYLHIHGHNDWWRGQDSTSHIESIWQQLKLEIKSTYKMIPSLNFLYFLREAEWKIKNKYRTYEEKIEEFFLMYNLVSQVGEQNIYDSDFLNNEDIN